MTSMPPNGVTGGKSSSSSSSHPPAQQHQTQSLSPGFENSAGASARRSNPLASPRNKQSSKKQHKNQRRPLLADEDMMAESTAVRNSNSRRGQTSITHLMNFTLPPRPQYHSPYLNRRRNVTYGLGTGYHAIDKARYIHANYRFIVNPNGDYHRQSFEADAPLDWNNVLQVLASAQSQTSSCPICLSPPVAPRMAKCGHIFCLPCLIRYMHSTNDSDSVPEKKARWKKCPICWDTVYLGDTRPVRWYTGQEGPAPREGDDVVLRLVTRQPGSTLALPRDGADSLSKTDDIPWYFAAEVTDFARVMKGSEEYMLEQYNSEIEALQEQERLDELMFGEETEFTKKAVRAVNDAKDKVKGIGNPPESYKLPTEKKPKREQVQLKLSDEAPEMYNILHALKSGQSLSGISTPMPAHPTPTIPTQAIPVQELDNLHPHGPADHPLAPIQSQPSRVEGHHPDEPYYFYQALLQYYLAPLDIRVLKAAFGTFSSFPSTILPRVEHVSTGHIVDDDLRKRTKYLAHLPYGCEVSFLECDWTDVVIPEVLEKFQNDIDRRRKRNKEKEAREEKDRLRAEREEEDKRWAASRRRRPSSVSEEDLSRGDFHAPAPASQDVIGASPPWGVRQGGSSFATLASPSTSPNHPRTVWGTALVAPASPELVPQLYSEQEDGWLQDWEKELTAENELIVQAQATSLDGDGDGSSLTIPQSSVKKKKGKKIMLMTTTARRAA